MLMRKGINTKIMAVVAASVLLFAACCRAASDEESSAPAPRPVSIAVFDFSDTGTQAPGVGRAVADMIIGRIAEDPVFTIFERGRLDEIMQEQNRANPSDKDGNSLRAGKSAGVRIIITGKVSEFGVSENSVLIPAQGTVTKYKARVTLDIRAVSVADARVVKTWNSTGSETSFNLGINILGIPNFSFSGSQFDNSLLGKATRKAVESAAEQIMRDFRMPELQAFAGRGALSGIVADADGSELVLNIGKAEGAEAGLSVLIYRVTKEIRDPETNELLTEKRMEIGEALIVNVEEKFSEAMLVRVTDGEEVRRGDAVEVKPQEEKQEHRGGD